VSGQRYGLELDAHDRAPLLEPVARALMDEAM
jgi:hypothetical protein